MQGELSNEYESHTRNEFKPSLSNQNNRAYCDLCEEFGHEETDCPKAKDQPAKADDDEEF